MRPAKPEIDLSEAESWATRLYGLDAVASYLPGEVDRNILLTADDESRWVLKVAPAGTADEEIECQLAVLEHLADSDLRQIIPRLVRDRQGGLVSRVHTIEGEPVLVRVVSYLSGRPLASLDRPTSDLRIEIGRVFGRLDLALESFDHRGARRHHFWDLVTLLELRPMLERLAPEIQSLVRSGLEDFASRIAPRLSELPASVIHNDANDYNLLVEDGEHGPRLSGIIDFGDMVYTITVAELAIACVYAMLGAEDPQAAATEVTAGYESARVLGDLERALLPELIVARLCHSLLMSAEARIMAPDDGYLRVSEPQVTDLLRRLGS